MTFDEFVTHASQLDEPPAALSPLLQSLWHARRHEWDRAHTVAQSIDSPAGSLVHAHLHRQEGDLGNARYWYQRAGEPVSTASIEDECESLIRRFLKD